MSYYVYILTNRSRTIYVGVTNDITRRTWEHRQKLLPGFTAKYNIDRLIYFEETEDIRDALEREKKIALIEASNPDWREIISW